METAGLQINISSGKIKRSLDIFERGMLFLRLVYIVVYTGCLLEI